jgi:hypothetical protein
MAQGSVTSPSVHTVQKLYDYFSHVDAAWYVDIRIQTEHHAGRPFVC